MTTERYERRIEQAKHWPTFTHGALTPAQRDVVGWLAHGSARPRRIKRSTLKSLTRRGIVTTEGGRLVLTALGHEYARTMRS